MVQRAWLWAGQRLGSFVVVVLAASQPVRAQQDADDVDELLRRVETTYARKEEALVALVADVAQAVEAELAVATFTAADGEARALAEHPFLALVAELSTSARARAAGKKNPPEVTAVLRDFPWPSELELTRGLEFGADRAIPRNHDGFIELKGAPSPLPGYPELFVNRVLFGTGELASWQTGVERKNSALSWGGRRRTERVPLAEALPPWEELRVWLTGTVPDVPLLALPELTLRLHLRLAEHRRKAGKEHARVDALLGLLDATWNGFVIDVPYRATGLACSTPILPLLANRAGFFYRFAESRRMESVGDLPFLAVQTQAEYARKLRKQRVTPQDLMERNAKAEESTRVLTTDVNWLIRYVALLDLVARALLCPEVPYPQAIAVYDYPNATPPPRAQDYTYDVPRRHALILWAALGANPERLADWLWDEVLSNEENAFPHEASLAVAFLERARTLEPELLEQAKTALAASDSTLFGSTSAWTSDPALANLLAHDFHAAHSSLGDVIRAAARRALEGGR